MKIPEALLIHQLKMESKLYIEHRLTSIYKINYRTEKKVKTKRIGN